MLLWNLFHGTQCIVTTPMVGKHMPMLMHRFRDIVMDPKVDTHISIQFNESQCNITDPNVSTQILRQMSRISRIRCKSQLNYIDTNEIQAPIAISQASIYMYLSGKNQVKSPKFPRTLS